jgi:uncharacterized protein YjbI with pentapeptide repeats
VVSGCRFEGADLTRANLAQSHLWLCDFKHAELYGADLTGAVVSGCRFEGADLTRAAVTDDQLAQALSLAGATLPDGTRLSKENWRTEFEEWRENRQAEQAGGG